MRNLYLSLMFIILCLTGCEKEIEYNKPHEKPDAGLTVNSNPFMFSLDNSSLNNTNGPGMYYDSTGEMRILLESLHDNFINSIDTGCILTVDLDTTGLLRKIDSFYVEQDEMILETGQAKMGDVFLNADFTLTTEEMTVPHYKSEMTDEEISRALTDKEGMIHPVRITCITPHGNIIKSAFQEGSTYLSSGFEATLLDTCVNEEAIKVWLEAYLKAYSNFILSFNYKFGYLEFKGWNIIYHPGRLVYFGAYYNGGIETSASINILASYEAEYEKVKKLKNDLFKISYKFLVGPVPVFIDVSCDIYGRVTCSFNGEVKASSGFQTSADLKLGVAYDNGSLSPITEFTTEKKFNPLTVEGSVSVAARAELYPQFLVSIYGAGGPTLDLVPYLSAAANASASYALGENALDAAWDANVDFGVDARVGAKLEILGATLAKYESGNITIISPVNIWRVPASIEITGGNNQQGTHNVTLSDPLVVRVKDSWSIAFPGIPVAFSVTEGSGSLNKSLSFSNLSGEASNYWHLGNTGTNICTALIKKADGTVVDSVVFTAQAAK
jgi:hypothetical protein